MKKSKKLEKKDLPKKKDIFGIGVKNCTIDVIFIKIGLHMWKADDPMLNFCSVNFYLAATVYIYMFDENCSRGIFILKYAQYFITSQ